MPIFFFCETSYVGSVVTFFPSVRFLRLRGWCHSITGELRLFLKLWRCWSLAWITFWHCALVIWTLHCRRRQCCSDQFFGRWRRSPWWSLHSTLAWVCCWNHHTHLLFTCLDVITKCRCRHQGNCQSASSMAFLHCSWSISAVVTYKFYHCLQQRNIGG